MDNSTKADNAQVALDAYEAQVGGDPDDIEVNITDLIVDLLHLAKRETSGLDVGRSTPRILSAVRIHIEAEE